MRGISTLSHGVRHRARAIQTGSVQCVHFPSSRCSSIAEPLAESGELRLMKRLGGRSLARKTREDSGTPNLEVCLCGTSLRWYEPLQSESSSGTALWDVSARAC